MSIAGELALLANTKEGLRVSLELSEDVPFSQYAAYIPWGSEGVPTTASVFDFSNNRYAKDGRAVYLSDISQFTRLSSATMWKSDKVVDVPENTPRINPDGLLIEPQRTNYCSRVAGGTASSRLVSEPVGIVWERTAGGAIYFNSSAVNLPSSPSVFSVYQTDESATIYFNGNDGYKPASRDNGRSFRYTNETINVRPHVYGAPSAIGDLLFSPQLESGTQPSSYIVTVSTPVTRAKETLVIPFNTGQTVTADKDAGVTMTIVDNNAVFEGQGYIRSIEVN